MIEIPVIDAVVFVPHLGARAEGEGEVNVGVLFKLKRNSRTTRRGAERGKQGMVRRTMCHESYSAGMLGYGARESVFENHFSIADFP